MDLWKRQQYVEETDCTCYQSIGGVRAELARVSCSRNCLNHHYHHCKNSCNFVIIMFDGIIIDVTLFSAKGSHVMRVVLIRQIRQRKHIIYICALREIR